MVQVKRAPGLTLQNAQVMFRNFSGKEGVYNAKGDRNFCVFLDVDLATELQNAGWNIKMLKPREDGDVPQAYVEVKVSYKNRPPNIVLITSRGRTKLDEDDIDMLDWVEIEKVDLIINPSAWDVNGKTGIKAYLKSFFITIVEDELELKYADVPDSAKSGLHVGPQFRDDDDD